MKRLNIIQVFVLVATTLMVLPAYAKECTMKNLHLFRFLTFIGGIILTGVIALPTFAQDTGKIEELQRVIDVQQKQIDAQQKHMERQQKQLDAQKQLLEDFQKKMESLVKETKTVVQTPAPAAHRSYHSPIADHENIVTTTAEERVRLSVSGWVNRAVNIVDDGKDTDAYFVDNDNAESRVNFAGTAKVTDDLTLGGMIELTIAPNKAGNVNQERQETGDVFDQRITEATLDSKRFGKLSLGKGFSAAYGTAQSDLSRTSVIATSTIADTAGGMLFRQKDDDALTDLPINVTFQTFDGLARVNRVRYDTPSYHGFHLSAAAISDQRYDAALWWGGQGYGFKAIGAVGLADPNKDDTGLQYDGSFSLLHEGTGLNLSLSAGLQERDNQDDAQHFYGKLGWLNRFFTIGETAFAVDYIRTPNQPTENDEGYSVGATAVQFFEEYGTELYFLYRLHSLDRDVEPEVNDINVLSIGTRVKF